MYVMEIPPLWVGTTFVKIMHKPYPRFQKLSFFFLHTEHIIDWQEGQNHLGNPAI